MILGDVQGQIATDEWLPDHYHISAYKLMQYLFYLYMHIFSVVISVIKKPYDEKLNSTKETYWPI